MEEKIPLKKNKIKIDKDQKNLKKDDENENITLNVLCNDTTYQIYCGEGKQTLKWLSLIISQKANNNLTCFPSGSKRLRERNKREKSFLLPKNIIYNNNILTNPYEKICDIFNDGDTVEITLHDTIELDSFNFPIISKFASNSFLHTENSKELIKIQNDEKKLNDSNTENKLDDLIYFRDHKENKSEIFNYIISGKLKTSDEIEEALLIDFENMNLNSITKDKHSNDLLYNELLNYYDKLNDIFIFYCGRGIISEIFGLGYLSFLHFLYQTDIILREEPYIKVIFKECCINNLTNNLDNINIAESKSSPLSSPIPSTSKKYMKKESNIRNTPSPYNNITDKNMVLSRPEFIVALLRVLIRHDDTSTTEPNILLRNCMNNNIIPYFFEKRNEDLLKREMNKVVIQEIIHRNYKILLELFRLYSEDQNDGLLYDEFYNILTNLDLQEFDNNEEKLEYYHILKDLSKDAFDIAQGGEKYALNELVFPEFLEAYCRVFLYFKNNNYKNESECIQSSLFLLIEKMLQLKSISENNDKKKKYK